MSDDKTLFPALRSACLCHRPSESTSQDYAAKIASWLMADDDVATSATAD